MKERDGGTITAEGVYTAPSQQGTYHVIATSSADPSQTAQATVSVIVPTPTPLRFSLSVSPAEAVLVPGAKQEFRATLTGISDTRVEWRVPGTRVPVQTADTPVTFTASQVGEYTVRVTSVADLDKWAEAKVKVVPGVWVRVDKKETTSPNVGRGMPDPAGSVSLAAGSTTASNQTGPVVSTWRLTWTEPPASLAVGQKFSGSVSVGDDESAYDDEKTEQFPSGSSSIQMRQGGKILHNALASAGRSLHGDYPFDASASQSFEFTVPPGRADGPPLEIVANVTAGVYVNEERLGGLEGQTQMRGAVVYTYELRAQ